MDGILDHLWPIIASVALAALTWGTRALFKFLEKKGIATQAEADFHIAIVAAAERAKDKFLAELQAAKDTNSPGGAAVTAEEWSKIRQMAYDLVLSQLKGPALEYAKERGEGVIKGLISRVMRKIGIEG